MNQNHPINLRIIILVKPFCHCLLY